jgi:KaiC/GvpD/RAD55 family RecA-like ATPase
MPLPFDAPYGADEAGTSVDWITPSNPAREHSIYQANQIRIEHQLQGFLDAPASQFLRYPFPDLHGIVGGMLPGEVHYVGAFSGNGKTLMMLSLALEWALKGIGVYYLGLETGQMALYAQALCMAEGLRSSEIMTGRAWDRPDFASIKARLMQRSAEFLRYPLYLAPTPRIDLPTLRHCFDEASHMDASVLMVDHVDHLKVGGSGDLYTESVVVNQALADYAKESRMIVIASTQFNNDAVRGDPLDRYMHPREHYVKMGSHKREIATSMLGLYRPLRQNVSPDELKAVRAKALAPKEILEPWQMAVLQMKSRKDGEGEGSRCLLSTSNYRVAHLAERDKFSTTYDGLKGVR